MTYALVLAVLCASCSSPSSSSTTPDASSTTHPDADHPADGGLQVKRIFATHTVYMGSFGGVEAGDQLCNSAAQTAQLGGAWKAWLSTSAANAIDRIADVGPWYLVDGTTLVFANKAALVGSPRVAIDHDELGNAIPQHDPFNVEGAWTGTLQGGKAAAGNPALGAGADCSDWLVGFGETAMFGSVMDTSTWTNTGEAQLALCDEEQEHLYCFEQ